MTEITLTLKGPALTVSPPPVVTSGGVGTLRCSFVFDGAWTGFSKTAVFFQNPKSAKQVPLGTTGRSCIVPWETLTEPKPLYIGVFGVKGEAVLTSQVAALTVQAGARVEATAPADPTPDVYDQILNLVEAYRRQNAENARLAAESEERAHAASNLAQTHAASAEAAHAAVVTEEAARQVAEGQRSVAEAARATAEQARTAAEAARATAEQARAAAEAARSAAEAQRVAAESQRAANHAASSAKIAENTAAIRALESALAASNPGGEPRVALESHGIGALLPKNAAPAGLKVTLRGVTAENLIVNGDLSDGTTGWGHNPTSTTAPYISEGALYFTPTGQYGIISQLIFGQSYGKPPMTAAGHKFYAAARVKATDSMANLGLNDGVLYSTRYHTGSGKWERLSLIRQAAPNANALYLYVRSDNTAGWTEIGAKDVLVVDLTAWGLDHLTREQCDALFDRHFSGTKAATAPRLRAVGKNLLNQALLQHTGFYTTGFTGGYRGGFVQLEPDTTYRVSVVVRGTLPMGWYRVGNSGIVPALDGLLLVSSSGTVSDQTVTTLSDGQLWFYCAGGAVQDYLDRIFMYVDIQVERGTVTTPFEPYRESTLYTEPCPLRRTPAGVCDEISDGTLTQRVAADGTPLADPVVVADVTSGTLAAIPGGTVFAEPALADAGVYASGITVFRTGFPIQRLESVSRVDFATGQRTPLDIYKATVAPDGLSFTHPCLFDGDLVFFTYFYRPSGPQTLKTYGYLDSRHVVADTADGKYYTFWPVVTDGVITGWETREV